MHVITRQRLQEYAARHPDAAGPLRAWRRIVEGARFASPSELLDVFPWASIVGKYRTVFRIAGNRYRLVADVRYDLGRIYIRGVYTHAEYDDIEVREV